MNQQNITDKSSEEFLQAWKTSIIPDLIALSIYFVVGIAGNTIVLIVYRYKMTRTSSERYFIPILATIDLIASTLISSLGILHDVSTGYLKNKFTCSLIYFISGLLTSLSCSILFCIAIQRYLKICTKFRLSLNLRRRMVISSVIFCIAISSPYFLTVGIMDLKTNNFTVTFCIILPIRHSVVHPIASVAFLVFAALSFVCIYGRIGFIFSNHVKTMKQLKNVTTVTPERRKNGKCITGKINSPIVCKTAIGNIRSNGKSDEQIKVGHIQEEKSKADGRDVTVPIDSNSVLKPNDELNKISSDTNLKLEISNRKAKNKLMLMFMVMTGTFCFCYIPTSILLIVDGFYHDLWMRIPAKYVSVALFFCHFYIANNIVNPFIFAFMDKEFKIGLKALFKKCPSYRQS